MPEESTPLLRLIGWVGQLDDLVGRAKDVDHSGGASVQVRRVDVERVLARCIAGELDTAELSKWAETIHALDRVEISDADADILTQFLFEISSPEIFEEVSVELCRKWMKRISE
jgi:hypothetical protein